MAAEPRGLETDIHYQNWLAFSPFELKAWVRQLWETFRCFVVGTSGYKACRNLLRNLHPLVSSNGGYRGGSRIFCREGSNSRRGSRSLGVGQCADRSLPTMRAVPGSDVSPRKFFKSRCSEMGFLANPDCTILAQNYIELLCEARGGLVAWAELF
jgi:hypothetical protein